MNRIELLYDPRTKNTDSKLRIFNDIKGYSCDQIGPEYTVLEADLMFKLLSVVDYSKLDDRMNYGIRIRNSEGDYESKVNDRRRRTKNKTYKRRNSKNSSET